MNGNDDMAVVAIYDDQAALDAAEAARAQAIQQEEAEVKAWEKRLTSGRAFDKAARAQYAKDRSYCTVQGMSEHEVHVPIAAAYLDVLSAYLSARDPALDCQPALSAGPARLPDARSLSRALNLVIAGQWKSGKLKAAVRPETRSSLSVGAGWIKALFLTRTGQDPLVQQQIDDLQDNLARITAYQRELAEDEAHDRDAIKAALESSIQGLQAKVEVVQARGMVFDFATAESIQVAPECPSLERYLDSPWIAHKIPISRREAAAKLPLLDEEQLRKATTYTQRSPSKGDGSKPMEAYQAEDADAFVAEKGQEGCEEFVIAWEIWDKDAGVIRTWVEGTCRWARPTSPPEVKSTRFYPFFSWQPLQVDGQRHPESLVNRSADLLDEYDRVRRDRRKVRRRSQPKTAFDSGNLEKDDAERIASSDGGELVPIDAKGQPVGNLISRLTTPEFNPALYDTGEVRAELELVWGIQEALASSIQTAKTATEADIQDSGTQARMSFYRDSLDEQFLELAEYSAEVLLGYLPREDAIAYAGPEVYWPAGMTLEQLRMLLSVDIRAGSSTKAASGLRQERWTQLSPVLRDSIMQIAQLRNANPLDVANCLEEMLKETLERFGENLDPARFVPQPGQPVQLLDPTTMTPVMAFPALQQAAGPGMPAEQPGPPGPLTN